MKWGQFHNQFALNIVVMLTTFFFALSHLWLMMMRTVMHRKFFIATWVAFPLNISANRFATGPTRPQALFRVAPYDKQQYRVSHWKLNGNFQFNHADVQSELIAKLPPISTLVVVKI